jgi:hypothetical protein
MGMAVDGWTGRSWIMHWSSQVRMRCEGLRLEACVVRGYACAHKMSVVTCVAYQVRPTCSQPCYPLQSIKVHGLWQCSI